MPKLGGSPSPSPRPPSGRSGSTRFHEAPTTADRRAHPREGDTQGDANIGRGVEHLSGRWQWRAAALVVGDTAHACLPCTVVVVARVVRGGPALAAGSRRPPHRPRGCGARMVWHGWIRAGHTALAGAGHRSAVDVVAAGLGALWMPWGWAAHQLLDGSSEYAPPVGRTGRVAELVGAGRSGAQLADPGGPPAPPGVLQWNQPATLASASLAGVWLTSFLIVAVNTAISCAILNRHTVDRIIAAAAALACVGLGPAWFWLGPTPLPLDGVGGTRTTRQHPRIHCPARNGRTAHRGFGGPAVDLVVPFRQCWGRSRESPPGHRAPRRPVPAGRRRPAR